MSLINLKAKAQGLSNAWVSSVLTTLGTSQFKLLRMDGKAYPNESHPFDEVLLVIDGQMNLQIHGALTSVQTGEVFIVPKNTPHAVAEGSFGTLVILDQMEQTTP